MHRRLRDRPWPRRGDSREDVPDQIAPGEAIARRLFLVSLALVLVGGGFVYGTVAQREGLPPAPQLQAAWDTLASLGDNELVNHPRRHHLQPTRGQGDGVTTNLVADDGGLVMMAGFFDDENQVRLVDRDGTVVRSWSLDYLEHFPDPAERVCDLSSPLAVDTHGVIVTSRGEVVVNYEYCGTVALDACGEVLWRLAKPTHHSIAPAEDGGYWILGRRRWSADRRPDWVPPVFDPAEGVLLEDTLLRVGADGEVLDEISIPRLLQDGGMEGLLTASSNTYPFDAIDGVELVHANKVAELSSAIADAHPMFEAGDLALSLRGRNLLLVVDPVGRQVRWHQTGPWLRQHDPHFRPDGRISVFNNNVYGTAYVDGRTDLETPFTTNILAVDPVSGRSEVVFGERPGQELLSVIRGKHQLLDDGGMLITEFDGGRVLQADADGDVVWEYVNAFDDDHVGEVTDALLYPAGHFASPWPSCES